ncbi:L,D-transpeptidase family protein [Candidatus Magnetaquicoccus inordinatus]|uniref:L,D-transpeptidase family protein n=1 Tax=Candidatus Magnetaquicoccus inordinatus TaxID=2496818 RepID=UPI00102C94B9|nr:L,D-transpeptidase family protein [Candidatus Magnetaquicoccus inordinatus]
MRDKYIATMLSPCMANLLAFLLIVMPLLLPNAALAANWHDITGASSGTINESPQLPSAPVVVERDTDKKESVSESAGKSVKEKSSQSVKAVSLNRDSGLLLHWEDLLSTVSYGEVPWRRRWYPYAPNDEVTGVEMRYMAQSSDTLIDLARILGVGFNELRDANPDVNVWVPEAGTVIKVPYKRVLPRSSARIIVNLPEMRVYHKRRDGWLDTYPIGIGREGLLTPQGATHVTRKAAYPTWYVPESIRKDKPHLPRSIPSGPDNPLGTHAVYLSIPGYLMHGTQKPYGVGRRVSYGCMRLYPEDIVRFYEEVAVNDTVEIVNQPIKAGWQGEKLYLQVHDVLSYKERATIKSVASKIVSQALQRRSSLEDEVVVDWQKMYKTIEQASGIPQMIAQVWHPPELEHLGAGWAWEYRLNLPVKKKVKAVGAAETMEEKEALTPEDSAGGK